MRLLRKIFSPLALVAASVGIILTAVILLTPHDAAGPGTPPASGDEGKGVATSPGPEASGIARTASTVPGQNEPIAVPAVGGDSIQANVEATVAQPTKITQAVIGSKQPVSSPAAPGAATSQASVTASDSADTEQTGRTYVVKAGDTPASIALQELGKASSWQEIARVNPGLEARSLQIGQVLQLPGADTPSTEAGQGTSAERLSSAPKVRGAPLARHRVTQGDSLYQLARQYYGDASKWTLIRDANPTELGGGVQGMRLGSELVIPALP